MKTRRRWCLVAGAAGLCYCCTLIVYLTLLDAEDQSWLWDRTRGVPGAERTRASVCGHIPPSKRPSCQQKEGGRSVLVVGALSFLGSRLASHLAGRGWTVTAVSQDDDITTEKLVWYRKEQLSNLGIQVKILNFSNESTVAQVLAAVNPQQVVYFPPGLDNLEHHSPDSGTWCQYLTGFTALLEALRRHSNCTRLLLASQSEHSISFTHLARNHNTTHLGAWMKSFELTLSMYHQVYWLPVTILRVDGVYGPWSEAALSMLANPSTLNDSSKSCWYVGDVVQAFQSALQLESYCEVLDLGHCGIPTQQTDEHTTFNSENDLYSYSRQLLSLSTRRILAQGTKMSLSWAKSYKQNVITAGRDQMDVGSRFNTGDVIFTSYFTTTEDSQRNRRKSPDRFRYMMNWFLSVKQLSLQAVVFHDGLDLMFRHRLTQNYPHISFQLVPSLNNRSTNDARFYAYLSFLESHPEITRVLLTDISDVRFQMNPFDLMSIVGGEWLYIGTDIDIFPRMGTMPWLRERLQGCYGNHSVAKGEIRSLTDLDTVYNAGVIGGSREVMTAALTRVAQYLDFTPHHLNCNMPAVNFAIHKHFFEQVFTGFPLTSRFLRRQSAPKGVFIVHK